MWSPWVAAPFLHEASGVDTMPLPRTTTDVIGMSGSWIQARLVQPDHGNPRRVELPRQTVVTLICTKEDGGTRTASTTARSLAVLPERELAYAIQGAPTIISRAGWGADDAGVEDAAGA